MAEKQIKKIELEDIDIKKYKALLKLYDQADIINDMV
jgi:ATP-dependent DNA helicase RecG